MLDVKVWEPSVISLFQSLGNTIANSVWEELLQSRSTFHVDLMATGPYKSDKTQLHFVCKPNTSDFISVKEKFIHAKYADKQFVRKPRDGQYPHSVSQQIWEAVRTNDKKSVYHLIVNLEADVNAIYEQAFCSSSLTLAKVMLLQEHTGLDHCSSCSTRGNSLDQSTSSLNLGVAGEGRVLEDLDGCSLLHLACETADIGMLELLLQYGANINATDSSGHTPLHRCIRKGRAAFAKLLLSRGADSHAANAAESKTPYKLAIESNFADNNVIAILSDSNG